MSPAARAIVALLALAGCAQAWHLVGDDPIADLRARASALRGLDFTRHVPLEWLTREQVREVLRAELEAQLAPEFAREYRDALAAIGVLPPQLDLLETYLEVNAEQLAGLYSISQRKMFAVRSAGEVDGPLVIHELVHALQHQHFGPVLELMQGLRRNDDVVLALASAAEGDATWVMLAAQPGAGDAVAAAALESMRAALRLDLERPRGALARAPTLVRSALLHPYVAGLELARERRAGGDPDALLVDPPLSTRPGPTAERVPVTFVGLPDAWLDTRLARRDCTRGHDNVLGPHGLRVLFSDHGGPVRPRPAWRGDRFVHLRCADAAGLIWISRWADAEAAARFAADHEGIAGSIERRGGAPGMRARVRGPDVIVASAGLGELAAAVHSRARFRSFENIAGWVAAGCFPEFPCPSS